MEPEHEDQAEQAVAARLQRLRGVAPPDPPPAIEARLRASLAARRRRRSRVWLAGAGSAALAAACLGLWLRPADQPPPPAAPAAQLDRSAARAPRPPAGRFRALAAGDLTEFTHAARVELAAETAAYFGWPVAPDVPRARVQAEVLYGDDGVARGLRFLPASFTSLPLPDERDRQGVNP